MAETPVDESMVSREKSCRQQSEHTLRRRSGTERPSDGPVRGDGGDARSRPGEEARHLQTVLRVLAAQTIDAYVA